VNPNVIRLSVAATLILLPQASIATGSPPCVGSDPLKFDSCQGTETFSNGDKYVGEYKDGKRNGRGTYTADGGKYVGEFKDGKRNGQGTWTYSNGEKYVGEFLRGTRHGQGTLTYADGSKYIGGFRYDRFNGRGVMSFADGREYVGQFGDGDFNGQGALTYTNGKQYAGAFKDGRYVGHGSYTYADRSKRVEKNRPVASQAQGLEDRLPVLKATCEDLGFTPKTEKFGECVLKMADGDLGLSKGSALSAAAEADQRYREAQLEIERERLEQERRYRQEQLASLQRAQREAERRFEKEQERRESMQLMQLGLELMGGGGAYSGSRSPFQTYIIDGHHVTCSTMGNVTTCN
jgi:hypothetical protein